MVTNERFWEQLPRMDQKERAKQFIPFSPLRGYEELLRAKEREVEAQANFPSPNPESHP